MIIIVLLLFILVSLWMGFYQLFKPQGRVLLRLNQLEQLEPAAHGGLEKPGEPGEPGSLSLGSYFPAFGYPDLAAMAVSLDDFRGRRVLLLNWSFECGFCDSIATPLANHSGDGACSCFLRILNVGLAKSLPPTWSACVENT
jgi:hypothetical protein